jgi:sugar lactone lactonase YvrE
MTDTSTPLDEQQGWREAERRRIQRTRRTLIGALAVLVVLLLIASFALLQIFQPVGKVASSAESNGVTWVRSIYGWGKTADEQFAAPQGVAIGPDGTIWATTQAQNRVVGFNPDGSFNAMLYQGPAGSAAKFPNAFTFPSAVAVDPAGLIYIADQPRSTVWVVSRDNKIVRSIFVPTPSSIAVSNDRLVVGAASGFVILTPTGGVVKVVGTQGKGIDQFQGVRGVAIAKDGTIFVTDQFNNRLSAYDRNGVRKWILSIGNPGNQKKITTSNKSTVASAVADMQIPAGMTIDGAGRIVIADPFGFDFAVFDPSNGKILAKYGNPGTIDGQFVYPSDIAYDASHDWFAVADTQNGRVQIIRLPGSGGSTLSGVNRTLTGPLRACIIPLLLIILVIVGGIIYRVMNRRRRRAAAAAQEGESASQDGVESVENAE